ncbi:MAG: DUF429 domain-containing protein [Leptolyngbyaceae cyanobacterium MO_188.B28]|nr:DUF429 domain-containing protein [Leptolyngbyaceae cyanobacterium MO_188.B28]
MNFLGIDLGWQSGPTGLCRLDWREGALLLQDLQRKGAISDILNWIDESAPPRQPSAIAVDAPTLIPNQTGMRLPDRLTHKYFGKYHAGCYPANLNRPFAERIVQFGLSLEARGFNHAPEIQPRCLGRYQIEVFPHPATLKLFKLNRILKYKKGKLADRRAELTKLRDLILTRLPTLDPPLVIPPGVIPDIPTKGSDLKALEDKLDSLICAYVAAHWWCWGAVRNWVLGDLASGYIVVPMPEGVEEAEEAGGAGEDGGDREDGGDGEEEVGLSSS